MRKFSQVIAQLVTDAPEDGEARLVRATSRGWVIEAAMEKRGFAEEHGT